MDTAGPRRQDAPAHAVEGERLRELLKRAEECKLNGHYRDGIEHAQRAVEIAELLGDTAQRTRALRLLSVQQYRLGDLEEAAKNGQLAVQLLEPQRDLAGLSESLCALSMVYIELGLHAEALKAVTQSLEVAQASGGKKLLCWAYNRFGLVHDAMGNRPLGQRLLSDALLLARELNDPEALFSALNNLSENAIGLVYQYTDAGDDNEADLALQRGLQYADEGLQVAGISGNAHMEALSLCNLGMLTGLAGDYNKAFRLLEHAERSAGEKGFRPQVLMASKYMADLSRLSGDADGAIAKFSELLRTAPEQADKTLINQAHLALAQSYKELGSFREALEHYERYHQLDREINTAVADTRARMLINRLELDHARVETERARLEASLHKLRSAELEAENTALVVKSAELDRRANEDALTGLWNRRHVEAMLPPMFEDARSESRPLSIAIGDIDRFKEINDRFGHLTGDQVLRTIAGILKAGCRPSDVVARVGGEEFVVVLVDTRIGPATQVCERLRSVIENNDWTDLHAELKVTISFGLSENQDAADPRQMLAEADSRLYEAKRSGRNRVIARPVE